MAAQFKDLCLDANDHQRLADWWCAAMGYVRRDELIGKTDRPVDEALPIVHPDGAGPVLWIVPVPERKSVKNRMHLDVWGDVDELLALGATLVRGRDEVEIGWDVLADPEGNEFCVFTPVD